MQNVPDMNVCGADGRRLPDLLYTNQQSARLMFYHDHAWGITRLNVYAGEAAGYLITDATEQKLIANGTIPGAGRRHPAGHPGQDLRADADHSWPRRTRPGTRARWGGEGNLWVPHVYMPAQNPGDPSGMNAFGRWMYGPWFWPPPITAYGPIANPYYDPNCDPNCDPATATNPFCEPELIPGTPNISVGHGSVQRHAAGQRHRLPDVTSIRSPTACAS